MTIYRRLCAWCGCPLGWFPEPQRYRLLARVALWVLWQLGELKTTHGACDACVERLEDEIKAECREAAG